MVEQTAISEGNATTYGFKYKVAMFCVLANLGIAAGLIIHRQFDANLGLYDVFSHINKLVSKQTHATGGVRIYQNEDYSWPPVQPYKNWAHPKENFPFKIKELPEPSDEPRIAVVTSCELREVATTFPMHLESILKSNTPPDQVILTIGLMHDLEWELEKLGPYVGDRGVVRDYLRHFVLRHQKNSDGQEYRLLRNSIDLGNKRYVKDLTPAQLISGLGLIDELHERDFHEWSRLGRGLVHKYETMNQTLEQMVSQIPDFKIVIKSEQRPWPGANWFHGAWNAFEGPYRARDKDIITFAHCSDILAPSRTEVTAQVFKEDASAKAFVAGKRDYHPMKPTELSLTPLESDLGLGVVLSPQQWGEGSRETLIQNKFFDHRHKGYRAEMMAWQKHDKALTDKFGQVIKKPWLDDAHVANSKCNFDSEFAWRLSMNETEWTPTTADKDHFDQYTYLNHDLPYDLYEGGIALRHRYIMFDLKYFPNTRYDADRRILVYTMRLGGEVVFNRLPLTLVKEDDPDRPEWYMVEAELKDGDGVVSRGERRYMPKKAYVIDKWFAKTLGEDEL